MAGAIPLEGVTAIMGPSGSGKTTLLSILSGLEPRATGHVVFGDLAWLDARRNIPARDRRVGLVFQDGRLFRHMTVADNITYGARRRNVEPAIVSGITAALGVRPLLHRRPATLSGGEARRVAVARAMASGPGILFMDEPLAGLDDDAKDEVLPYIARAVEVSGAPVVYVSHAQSEVTRLADRVLRVAEGRVLGWAPPPPVLSVTVLGSENGQALLELGGARFTLPGRGERWDARRIVIPEGGFLLSRSAPGASGALASLPVRVREARAVDGRLELALRVEGQLVTLTIPAGSELARSQPGRDESLWLSIVEAHLR
jgi:molybdate transport system ATP-binding protein